MGLVLGSCGITVPASCEDNVLKYYLGSKVVSKKISGAKGLYFPKQCNFFTAENVMCYLVGEKYSLVIRYDGTGTVFTTGTNYMRNTFVFDEQIDKLSGHTSGGSLYTKYSKDFLPVELYLVDSMTVLFKIATPAYIAVDLSKNLEYKMQIAKTPSYPPMVLKDNKISVIDTNYRTLYELDCECIEANGYISLGGVSIA